MKSLGTSHPIGRRSVNKSVTPPAVITARRKMPQGEGTERHVREPVYVFLFDLGWSGSSFLHGGDISAETEFSEESHGAIWRKTDPGRGHNTCEGSGGSKLSILRTPRRLTGVQGAMERGVESEAGAGPSGALGALVRSLNFNLKQKPWEDL